MRTEVVRSARRTKTVEAKLVGGVLKVSIPATMTASEEKHWVAVMQERIDQQLQSVDLATRAGQLAADYALPKPTEIVFSARQRKRWGSCTPATGKVRISSQVRAFPRWVIDYVIIHELAHLVQGNHSAEFWDLVNRYPLAERARGYLLAKGEA